MTELKNPNPEIVATLECGCQYFRHSGVRVHTCKMHEAGHCVACDDVGEAISPQGHGLCRKHRKQLEMCGTLKLASDWFIAVAEKKHD